MKIKYISEIKIEYKVYVIEVRHDYRRLCQISDKSKIWHRSIYIVIGLKSLLNRFQEIHDSPLDHHKVVRCVEATKAGGSRAAGNGAVVDV